MPFFSYETTVILICAAMGAVICAAAVKARLGWKTGVVMSVAAWLMCLAGARGFYILTCDLTGAGFWGPLFPGEPYFYAFGGGVLGFVAAMALTAKLTRKPLHAVTEAFTPAGLLWAAALRMTEALSDFGWGDLVEIPWMQRYPFAIENMYGEWCAAVFHLEALCALAVLIVILKTPGRRLSTALIWWAVTQIFCESLRVESIQWGFVRVQQLLSAIIVAAVMLLFTLKLPADKRAKTVLSWVVFAACIGLVIFLEYAIDKMPWPTVINYVAMAAVLGLMGGHAQKIARMERV